MAKTLFRGPVLQGKFNESGVTGFNLETKQLTIQLRMRILVKLLHHLLMVWYLLYLQFLKEEYLHL